VQATESIRKSLNGYFLVYDWYLHSTGFIDNICCPLMIYKNDRAASRQGFQESRPRRIPQTRKREYVSPVVMGQGFGISRPRHPFDFVGDPEVIGQLPPFRETAAIPQYSQAKRLTLWETSQGVEQ